MGLRSKAKKTRTKARKKVKSARKKLARRISRGKKSEAKVLRGFTG